MKKFMSMTLSLLLVVTMFCSCTGSDGEAGDKGNVKTNDVGDGGGSTSGAIKDIEDGIDSAGNAVRDGVNAVGDTIDGMMPDANQKNNTNMK